MAGELTMSRDALEQGFAQGRTLTQEEWAHPLECQWIDELIAEGKARVVDDWRYLDTFQCKRRRVQGVEVRNSVKLGPNDALDQDEEKRRKAGYAPGAYSYGEPLNDPRNSANCATATLTVSGNSEGDA